MTTELITSRNNARIKSIRKLRHRHDRDEAGAFLVEGIRPVAEAIQSGADVIEIIVAPDLLRSRFALDLVEAQRHADASILTVSSDVFASISDRDHPQGLAAVARQRWLSLTSVAPTGRSFWIALESVADPGNLGTIMRTADAVGASGIVLLGRSTDPFDPAAVRASMGAVFTQQIVRSSAENLVAWAQQNSVTLVGTSPDARVDYQEVDYMRPLVLLMGSEREGLDENLQRSCDQLVRLPMIGRVDSLNLAVATGVVLYEMFNQWRKRSNDPRRRGGARSTERPPEFDKAPKPRRRGAHRRAR